MRYPQTYLDQIRKEIPQIAFSLFSKNTIETVTMQDIADACPLGVATLYRYYGTKTNLVIDICAGQWTIIFQEMETLYQELGGEEFTARQDLEFYLDSFIRLYQHHKDFLKFYDNFEHYILHEHPSPEELAPYYRAVSIFQKNFCQKYRKTFTDHTLKENLNPDDLYFGIRYAMLPTVTAYAQESILPGRENIDPNNILKIQKTAYLDYLSQYCSL